MPLTDPFFPFPTIRPIQAESLSFIREALPSSDDVMIEKPTGTGKSGDAVALAREAEARVGRTYISTATVQLENQYIEDFGKFGLRQLHSKDHYFCPSHLHCGIGSRIGLESPRLCQQSPCAYITAKAGYHGSPLAISNAAFLLTSARFVEDWPTRDLAVFDEAHGLHDAICGVFEIQISSQEAGQLPCRGEELSWLSNSYRSLLDDRIFGLTAELKRLGKAHPRLLDVSRRLEAAERQAQNIETLLESDPNDWFFDTQPGSLAIRPLWAARIAQDLLPRIARKRVYLSATLPGLEHQARLLGLDPQKAALKAFPSPFPVQNRYVHILPHVKWFRGNLGATLPALCEWLKKILAKHSSDRGLVHVSSYDQARQVMAAMREPRLITHTGSRDKDAALARLYRTPGAVIISPSSHEGLDLYDERSRFQVVAKLPYAKMDPYVVKRMATNACWYLAHTAQKLMQACGRSIRSESDYAMTYLLDEAFYRFFRQFKPFLPQHFVDSLIVGPL